MAKLMPYEEYKKTGLDWIDEIPTHWKIKHTRYLWKERKETNYVEEQLLSVTINKGIVSQSELLSTTAKKDSSNLDKTKYKLVLQNDIAYNKMRMWQGAVGVSKFRGIVSPAYIVLKPIKEINHHYYHYLLRTPNYIGESYRFSYGICDDQLSLRYEDFKGMSIIVPPKEEQDQIAKFLDNRLSKINRFIKAKKRQIEFLKELKQAIINQAVTKGIDPNVPMKDSGVNWVKEIPTHWKIKHTRYLWKERKETNHVEEQLLSVTINRGIIPQSELLSTTVKRDTSNLDKTKYKLVLQNDIAYNKMRMWQGAVGVSKFRGIVSPAYIVLKPIKEINYYYYHYLLRTPNYIGESYRFSYGICDDQLSLRYEDFKGMSIIVPPKEEQDQIAKFLDNRLSKINRFIKAKKKQIELLKEYRTSLISAVVTGKVDVRHIPVEDTDEFIEDMDEEEIGEGDKEVLTC